MPDRSTCWRWPPEENCYCGGPEEIYPHRVGTGRYCRPTDTHPARPAEQDGGIPNAAITPDTTGDTP
ncbi:MAG: hypothetical protein JWO67_1066 [Streptosporangiaceae bacterium]|nr:hypothetical protein [Streptosporangiaceae bacterium]